MLKIQNLACIPLRVTTDDNVIPIIKDILRNKKINAMYFFFPSQEDEICSPLSASHLLTPIADIDDLNLFLNVTDTSGRKVFEDLNIKNISVQTLEDSFLNISIDKVLDFDKCFLNSKSVIAINPTLFLYVVYQKDHFEKYTDEVNGSLTVNIPLNGVGGLDYKLSDYVGDTLKGKKIKQIISSNSYKGYLNLYAKREKQHLENIPCSFLDKNNPKSFVFDPFEIDYEKSFLYDRPFATTDDYTLTFIY